MLDGRVAIGRRDGRCVLLIVVNLLDLLVGLGHFLLLFLVDLIAVDLLVNWHQDLETGDTLAPVPMDPLAILVDFTGDHDDTSKNRLCTVTRIGLGLG